MNQKLIALVADLEKEVALVSESEYAIEGLKALMTQHELLSGKEITTEDYLNTMGVYLEDYKTLKAEQQQVAEILQGLRDRVAELEDQLEL